MKRLFAILVAILVVSSLLLAACSQAAPSTPAKTIPPSTSAAPPASSAAPAPTSAAPAPTSSAPPTSAAPAKTYKFTYNNFFPPTHNNSILAEMWINEIQKKTNGAVQISYLPGASLTAPPKVYDGVVTGHLCKEVTAISTALPTVAGRTATVPFSASVRAAASRIYIRLLVAVSIVTHMQGW